ncbi:MAG: Hsp20/alpha crystallin family protein [Deltaproteobacteria bacterium]|nr:Hsp20/alpha crystallin family protein [Deltaproteobacteria bacterium]
MSKELSRHEGTRPETVDQLRWLKPACDVFESKDEWLITADVPGTKQDALHLHLDKGELAIEARRTDWFDNSQAFAGWRRVFSLPAGIDGSKVSAELKHGVVSIRLPKSEAIRPRRIAVNAG